MNTISSIISLSLKTNLNYVSIHTSIVPTIYNNEYYIYTFTDPSEIYDISFTNLKGKVTLGVLVVGGGGGGGTGSINRGMGGGGGGGVGIGYFDINFNCNLTVNVGIGGITNYSNVRVGSNSGQIQNNNLTFSDVSPIFNGGDTIIKQNNNIIINAYGGGGGGAYWNSTVNFSGSNGGSGGGFSSIGTLNVPGNATSGSGSITYYGNRGGLVIRNFNEGTGGGGAGSPGNDVSNNGMTTDTTTDYGYGGNGYTVNTEMYPGIPLNTYGGGGAGGCTFFPNNGVNYIKGGTGGGGNSVQFNLGTNGTDGLGGGGAGGGKQDLTIQDLTIQATGTRGGNGVVIISIPMINVLF